MDFSVIFVISNRCWNMQQILAEIVCLNDNLGEAVHLRNLKYLTGDVKVLHSKHRHS